MLARHAICWLSYLLSSRISQSWQPLDCPVPWWPEAAMQVIKLDHYGFLECPLKFPATATIRFPVCCIDTKRPVIFTAVNWICGSLSPTSGSLADGLAQKVQGLLRTCHTTVLGQRTILVFFKLTNPKLGEENPAEALKIPPFKKWLIFLLNFLSSSLLPALQRVFFSVCLVHMLPFKKKRIMIFFF